MSPLRTDKGVEDLNRTLAIDSDLPAAGSRPVDAERVEAVAEELLDVFRPVAEVVTDAWYPAVIRDDPTAVAVDQATYEGLALTLDDSLLPRHESDAPQVLAAASVLRDQARPMVPIHRDVHTPAVAALSSPGPLFGQDGLEGGSACIDNAWIRGVERDPNAVRTG